MSIVSGIARIARFRAAGFASFAPTVQALLNSLAPLVAFPLVGGLLQLGHGNWRTAIADVLATMVALLTPLVVTEFFARRWGRGDRWLRFAVASNWSQWALPVALLAILLGLWILANLGLPMSTGVVGACIVGLIIYGIALHWFLARVGLDLPRGRATLLVLVSDLLTGLLVLTPRLLVSS